MPFSTVRCKVTEMCLQGIVKELEEQLQKDDLKNSIKATWHYAQNWMALPDKDRSYAQNVTIQFYGKLTESFAIPVDFLRDFLEKYFEAVKLFSEKREKESKALFQELMNKIDNAQLSPIDSRVEHYRTSDGPAFIARAKKNEYFIAATGKLRRNFPYFDSWLKYEKDFIINYYTKSIRMALQDKKGYLVFIQKQVGPHGPILLKDYLIDNGFDEFGVVLIKNGIPEIERHCENKDYCILYDLVLSGDGIKYYESVLSRFDSDFRLKANIVIYNEQPDSDDFVLNKTIQLIKCEAYKRLLINNSKPYTKTKGQSSGFEDLMFAFGSSLALGSNEIGTKFENFAKDFREKIRITRNAQQL